jgi:hypothetical protein
MQVQRDKLTNRYINFMGSWMAGSIVGHYVAKIITTGLLLWFFYKALFN